MNTIPQKIEDRATAEEFVARCVEWVGPGYHPDTPFGSYIDDDGKRCFSTEEAELLDAATEVAFRFCDPYEVALLAVRSFTSA
jgi:hypothetical protein